MAEGLPQSFSRTVLWRVGPSSRWTQGSMTGLYYGPYENPCIGSMSFGLTNAIDCSSYAPVVLSHIDGLERTEVAARPAPDQVWQYLSVWQQKTAILQVVTLLRTLPPAYLKSSFFFLCFVQLSSGYSYCYEYFPSFLFFCLLLSL